jgi:hypothetical protein
LIFRAPVVNDLFNITEFAVSFGGTARWKLFGTDLYVGTGADLAFPIYTSLQWKVLDEERVNVGDRNPVNLGAVGEIGYEIITGLSVDLRLNYGLDNFDSERGHSLIQVLFGVSYLF